MEADFFSCNKQLRVTTSNIVIKTEARRILTNVLKSLDHRQSLYPLSLSKPQLYEMLNLLNGFTHTFNSDKAKLANLELMKVFFDIDKVLELHKSIDSLIVNKVMQRYNVLTR